MRLRYDAFRPHKKGSDVDINFEKASVLFNIATFYRYAIKMNSI